MTVHLGLSWNKNTQFTCRCSFSLEYPGIRYSILVFVWDYSGIRILSFDIRFKWTILEYRVRIFNLGIHLELFWNKNTQFRFSFTEDHMYHGIRILNLGVHF